MRARNHNKGFTLIEILIVLLISSLLMTAVYSSYRTQQKAYLIQDQVANMQQNLRAAMHFIERDLRMAGYDPNQSAGAGIISIADDTATAEIELIEFSKDDKTENGQIDSDEIIKYSLYDYTPVPDNGETAIDDLGRAIGTGNPDLVAENIETVNLVFLDKDGISTTDTGKIRSIEVTIIAKTADDPGDWTDRNYTNNNTYKNAQGTDIFTATGDHIRRMVISKRIRCRNLGLTGGQ